jgi:pyruvate/2-oxoglutarate/acetoin dehydrogenase E1 component
MPAISYLEAIRQGIWEEMERDPTVFCLGEDIGIYGGAFKVTDGLIARFGPERVIDTPIAESAIIGAAFGAALTGLRPVAEFQFMDFIGCAFNQIVNMAANQGGDPRQQSGNFFRAQVSVPKNQRRSSKRRLHSSSREGADRARGPSSQRDHLRRHALYRARSRGNPE